MDPRICAMALALGISLSGCGGGLFGSDETPKAQNVVEGLATAIVGGKMVKAANQAGTTHKVQGVCDEILTQMMLKVREGATDPNTFQMPAVCVEADRRWEALGSDFSLFAAQNGTLAPQ